MLNKKNKRNQKRIDRKVERRYKRANRKIAKAKLKGPEAEAKAQKKYGYDYATAIASGLKPDSTGHWASRDPKTGRILKGKKHPTFFLTKKAEKALGYKIYKKNGELYSKPRKKNIL